MPDFIKPTFLSLVAEDDFLRAVDQGLKIVVFHHDDMDGCVAAASACRYFNDLTGHLEKPVEVSFIPVNYDQQDDDALVDLIGDMTYTFVFDFAFSARVSQLMYDKSVIFQTLDHHKTNLKQVQGVPGVYFNMNSSGAKMAWEFFFGDDFPPTPAVTLVDNRDLWQRTDGREDPYHEGLMIQRSKATSHHEFIEVLSKGFTNLATIDGTIALGIPSVLKRDSNIKHVTSDSRLTINKVAGYPTVWVNYAVDQSDACEYLYLQERFRDHIIAAYSFKNNNTVSISFRKGPDCKADLSVIAENNFNGGGHDQAAGGVVDYERMSEILLGESDYVHSWPIKEAFGIIKSNELSEKEKVLKLMELPTHLIDQPHIYTPSRFIEMNLVYTLVRNTMERGEEVFTYQYNSPELPIQRRVVDEVYEYAMKPENMTLPEFIATGVQEFLEDSHGCKNNQDHYDQVHEYLTSGMGVKIHVGKTVHGYPAIGLGMILEVDRNEIGMTFNDFLPPDCQSKWLPWDDAKNDELHPYTPLDAWSEATLNRD